MSNTRVQYVSYMWLLHMTMTFEPYEAMKRVSLFQCVLGTYIQVYCMITFACTYTKKCESP
jgi:hypothetical protein